MKRIAIALTVSLLISSSCAVGQEKIELDGISVLQIKFDPALVGTPVKVFIGHGFPFADFSTVHDTLVGKNHQLFVVCPTRAREMLSVSIGHEHFEVLSAPGDTVSLGIEKKDGMQVVSYIGKSKPIQEYYRTKEAQLSDFKQKIMDAGVRAANLSEFKKKADIDITKLREFWASYRQDHLLPEWFKEYETDAIDYYDAWIRLYMVSYQIRYQKKIQEVPKEYYNFLKTIKVKNEKSLYQYSYSWFIWYYYDWRVSEEGKEYSQQFAIAKKELGLIMGSYFEIMKKSKTPDNPRALETLDLLQYPSENKYLVDYLKNRAFQSQKLLGVGDKAPNFALVDTRDSLVRLDQFKGQIIYLSFWFTTCGACVQEIPEENKIAERFKDEPFKIISICTGTPGLEDEKQIDRWKKVSNKFGLKTLNLFAHRSWANTLREKYFIDSYPHYVLIGADGKIIENFATRPSKGAAEKIEKLLAELPR